MPGLQMDDCICADFASLVTHDGQDSLHASVCLFPAAYLADNGILNPAGQRRSQQTHRLVMNKTGSGLAITLPLECKICPYFFHPCSFCYPSCLIIHLKYDAKGLRSSAVIVLSALNSASSFCLRALLADFLSLVSAADNCITKSVFAA